MALPADNVTVQAMAWTNATCSAAVEVSIDRWKKSKKIVIVALSGAAASSVTAADANRSLTTVTDYLTDRPSREINGSTTPNVWIMCTYCVQISVRLGATIAAKTYRAQNSFKFVSSLCLIIASNFRSFQLACPIYLLVFSMKYCCVYFTFCIIQSFHHKQVYKYSVHVL